jgi:hypothetical protein
MLVYCMAIWFIVWPFGIFCRHLVYLMVIWHIFPDLVCCTKKNLATSVIEPRWQRMENWTKATETRPSRHRKRPQCQSGWPDEFLKICFFPFFVKRNTYMTFFPWK